MGRISTVVFCDNVEIKNIEKNTKVNCLGILSCGSVPAVPSLYTLSVLVVIDISDPSQLLNVIRVVIKSPDDTVIFDQSLPGEQMPEIGADMHDLNVAMNIQNLTIRILGKHVFEFMINGIVEYTKELEIFRKEL